MRPDNIQEILNKNISNYETLESVENDLKTLKEYNSSLPLAKVDLQLCSRINTLYQYAQYWPTKVMLKAYDEIRKKQGA